LYTKRSVKEEHNRRINLNLAIKAFTSK
jgi:hypothetical protein